MRPREVVPALVQGTSLDRVEVISCKVRTGQSSLPQFFLDGMVFACSESYMFTTSELLASEEILMVQERCSREMR